MRLSIIIPVLNEYWYTDQILREIKDKTIWEYEVILLVSWYDYTTPDLSERVDKFIRLDKDKWVNWAWNEWVKLSEWEYIAILNNDILLDHWWDEKLIKWLDWYKLSSPMYTCWDIERKWTKFKNNRYNTENICWHCYVMRKDDWIDIPDWIKIWFWDNWIYKYIEWKQNCIEDIIIHHFESKTIKSGDFIDIINERLFIDKKNWYLINKS